MHVLMLTHHPPYPPISGGRVRAYELLRRLARSHDITLVYFARPDDETQETFEHLKQICHRVEEVPCEKPKIVQDRLDFRLRSRWPNSCLPFLSHTATDTISRMLAQEHFDVIHCVGYYIAQNLPKKPSVPVVLAEDNVEYVCAWRRFLFAKTLVEKVAAFFDFFREKRLEISVWKSVAVCIVTSELEKALVASRVRTRVEVVPNGVDADYFDDSKVPRTAHTYQIGMLANFQYPPNLDAFLYFRDRIMPHLSAKYMGPIALIGNADFDLYAHTNDNPNFIPTGRVPDVRPYLANVDVIVCPLRLGGGTKLKILESLAMRRAVVSTGVGVEGFCVSNWDELVIEDSPVSFANAVQQLLSNPKLRIQLGNKGRSYVFSNHDWDIGTSLVESIYRTLVAQPSTPN